ncbi:MAG TPA: RNA polymerase sigma-70 factor, partial [Chitinophagaceae bacterium]|nr:RNA polymerase sigma-70 factor [Chitinophagaceae bacterium]
SNQDAFNILYVRYWEYLYKFAFLILRDKDACKDVVQDVFIWVWEHRKGLEMHTPKSYLRTAVKYKIANYIRTGNIRNSFFDEAAQVAHSQTNPGSAEFAELKELKNVIQVTIAHLPVKCQEIYRLSREENLSNREIARQLGISVKTVENQMTIALHRIRVNVDAHLTAVILFPLIV